MIVLNMDKDRVKKIWLAPLRWLRRTFIAGLLVTVPIGLTVWILFWVFNNIDGFLQPLVRRTLGWNIPGIGFAITLILIFIIGLIAANVFGRRLLRLGDLLLGRIPIARHLYEAFREVFRGLADQNNTGYLQVVLVEFPRKGMKAIGFITAETLDRDGIKAITVFIPNAPNPTTGFVEILREEDIIRTEIPVQDALKMVVSAGRMSPKDLGQNFGSGTNGTVY